MPQTDLDRLRSIKTLASLVAYLRDELDWPIESDDIEDISFDYTSAELGIAAEAAVRIKEIKQLRPLNGNQPWGIFWVNFEKKQLPVVVMRLILRALVLKKRASSGQAERQAWAAHDLLFISAYGEETDRALSFAHFVENPGNNLAELRVLGWDDDDTPLHMDYVAQMLHAKLRWDNKLASQPDAWRQQWSDAFLIRHRHVVRTSKELATTLAALAQRIRSRIRTILRSEDGFGEMRKLQRAFQAGLIHDLDDDGFADMFAQTVTYGLFSVACRRTIPGEGTAFTKDDLPHYFTSPFLKEMLGVFLGIKSRKGAIDFDELGVSDVTDLLTSPDTHMEVVLADFNNKTRGEDPVIHFYQDFLTAYDHEMRVKRGVFYTPQPVVSYIVRSVHELLQTEFGLEDGLADTTTWGEMLNKHPGLKLPPKTDEHNCKETISPDEMFVQILDPATGTATFLVEVIEVIHKHLKAKWETSGPAAMPLLPTRNPEQGTKNFAAYWNFYVPAALLPRLHAFELMMAPYAIAHMKIGLKLAETGYRFGTEERARIYLTNALEPKVKVFPLIGFDALAHEAEEVNKIKWYKRFTVVIGNPPYAGHSRNNEIRSIVDLVKDFTRHEPSLQGPGQGKWLQDDYVKFLRISQHLLGPTKAGILAMITNHRYLTNRTFRGMRRLWRNEFPLTRILDLHGNRVVHEVSPLGHDDNVFDIEQGVAIGIFAKGGNTPSSIGFHELWGNRTAAGKNGKYDVLAATSVRTTEWEELNPRSPDWLFSPREEVAEDIRSEFESGVQMLELMPGALGPNGKPQSGLATMHDGFALSFTATEVDDKVRQFLATNSRDEAKEVFGTLCNPQQWDYATAKRTLASPAWRKKLSQICFSPFDTRYTIYDKSVAVHLRRRLSDHFFNHENLGLVLGEAGQEISGDDWDAVSCVDSILQLNYFRRNGSPTLPLYLYDDDLLAGGINGRRINLSPPHLKHIADRLGLKVGKNGLPFGLTPEDIFHYAYAVFHSPGYRNRYAEYLKIDFPRLPLPGNLELFRSLARLGGDLVALHLLESSKLAKPITEFIGGCRPEVEKISWSSSTVWLDKAQTTGIQGVSEAVWNFHIGGYQVCEKWLKDRKGRTLTDDDITHYHKIIVALTETIRLMAEIDTVIESHGGWPAAFVAEQLAEPEDTAAPFLEAAEVAYPVAAAEEVEELPIAAENHDVYETSESDDPVREKCTDYDMDDLMILVRRLVAAAGSSGIGRGDLVRAVAYELGYERAGRRVSEDIVSAINAASRRGISYIRDEIVYEDCRSIEQYPRDLLKDLFLAAIGRSWIDRDDAIRAVARHLGYARTGPNIQEYLRSVINGLIRDGRLEKAPGNQIRRISGS